MEKQELRSFMLKTGFLSNRIKYAYNDSFEVTILNVEPKDNEISINGTSSITLGIGDSEVFFFDSNLVFEEISLSITSKYHCDSFRTKQRPNFMGGGEYTSRTEGQIYETNDKFEIIKNGNNNYLLHSVDKTPYIIYSIAQDFKLMNGISPELQGYYLNDKNLNGINENMEEIFEKGKK